ncbi:hypothetical protein RFI_01595 [Reticulomyxa filosa]|uniref:Transmembrane protein n=1 Tax=Reticulomyxa filosa TaxID=46433 RepID=X6PAB8_RETFI|nr:hypothetical protein RFI_01595 [Reticulomyxa filosa]|eukprot:ETO35470.1 hypothetical protein RFI_01595 [Reticulomyxa filosa]
MTKKTLVNKFVKFVEAYGANLMVAPMRPNTSSKKKLTHNITLLFYFLVTISFFSVLHLFKKTKMNNTYDKQNQKMIAHVSHFTFDNIFFKSVGIPLKHGKTSLCKTKLKFFSIHFILCFWPILNTTDFWVKVCLTAATRRGMQYNFSKLCRFLIVLQLFQANMSYH